MYAHYDAIMVLYQLSILIRMRNIKRCPLVSYVVDYRQLADFSDLKKHAYAHTKAW